VWILILRPAAADDSPGAELLRQLGCKVRVEELREDGAPAFDPQDLGPLPPALVLLEVPEHAELTASALRRLRRLPALGDTPVLLAVSAARVTALDWRAGFDDFVLVPYVPQELYARVRQLEWRHSAFSQEEVLKSADLVVDLAAHEVRVAGREVALTHQELALLGFLMRHRGRVFSRGELLRRVWGVDHYGQSRTVDIHMRRLRAKLGRSAAALETVRGAGYKFREVS
jgi:DNA-binding response OmpR family regulator